MGCSVIRGFSLDLGVIYCMRDRFPLAVSLPLFGITLCRDIRDADFAKGNTLPPSKANHGELKRAKQERLNTSHFSTSTQLHTYVC